MESSLDETPDVYMTALTVDEIKNVLTTGKSARKIHRRNTVSDLQPSRIVFPDSPTEMFRRYMACDEDESLASDYFTAQETLTSKADSDVEIIDSDASCCEIVSTYNLIESPKLNDSTNRVSIRNTTMETLHTLSDCTGSCSTRSSVLDEIINLDDSTNSCRSTPNYDKLNTTLDEIERLLNCSNTQASEVSDTSCNLKSEDSEVHVEQQVPPSTPTYFKSPKVYLSKLPSRQKDFKVPPTKLFTKSPNFKHIVSPVATYIKRSPQVPLVQHVPLKTLKPSALPMSVVNKPDGKENCELALPPVVYKPGGKFMIVSKEVDVKLPKSLAKFVSNKPEIVKHEGRYNKGGKSAERLEKMLLADDLTLANLTLDSSRLSHDVSMLAIKNPYI